MRHDYKNQGQVERAIHKTCGLPMLGIGEQDPRSWNVSTLLDKTFCDCPVSTQEKPDKAAQRAALDELGVLTQEIEREKPPRRDSETMRKILEHLNVEINPEGGVIDFPFNVEQFCREIDKENESLRRSHEEALNAEIRAHELTAGELIGLRRERDALLPYQAMYNTVAKERDEARAQVNALSGKYVEVDGENMPNWMRTLGELFNERDALKQQLSEYESFRGEQTEFIRQLKKQIHEKYHEGLNDRQTEIDGINAELSDTNAQLLYCLATLEQIACESSGVQVGGHMTGTKAQEHARETLAKLRGEK